MTQVAEQPLHALAPSNVAVLPVAGGPVALAATLDGGQAFRWWPVKPDDNSAYSETRARPPLPAENLANLPLPAETLANPPLPSETRANLPLPQGEGWGEGESPIDSRPAKPRLPGKSEGYAKVSYRGVIGDRLMRLSEYDGGVEVTALDDGPMPDAMEMTADYLAAGADLEEFKQAFSDDPCIGPAVRGYSGLRLLRQDPWECLVSFICSSTSNVPRIKLNVGAVASATGRRIGPSDADFEFPAAAAVAGLGEQRLRDLGLGFRARYVAIAAEMAARGDLDLMTLRGQSYGDAKERLVAIHGVGEKIADCVLAFSLDKPEAFPIDRWTRRALEKWYGLSPRLNNSAAGEWARNHFGQYGAIAQQYMFHRERLAGRAASWGGAHNARALPEDVNG